MKISTIAISDLKNYLHVYHDEDDTLITSILVAAKAFVTGFTGLSAELQDSYEDLTMAVFILASELYDNRSYTVDKDTVNPVIKSILNMYSVNLL